MNKDRKRKWPKKKNPLLSPPLLLGGKRRCIARRSRSSRRRILMIMHPNFKNLSANPNSFTKPLHFIFFIFPLQLPPQLLSKLHHLLPLFSCKLCPKPLLSTPFTWLHHHHWRPGIPLIIPFCIVHHFHHYCLWGWWVHNVIPSVAVRYFAVEVAVATTGCTLEGGKWGVIKGELTTSICGIAPKTGCMVS